MIGRTSRALDALRKAGKKATTVQELCRIIGTDDATDVKHYSTTMLRLYRAGRVSRVGPVVCPVTGRRCSAYALARPA